MNKLILILMIFSSFAVYAQDESKHMISFGRNGLGWSGGYEKMKTEGGSDFDGVKNLLNDLALNYAYRIGSRWQLGGFYQSGRNEYKFDNEFVKTDTTAYGIFGLYNFSENFTTSYYLGASLSYFTMEEEISHTISAAENKAPFELDDTGNTYELVFGKRFSFEKWGIKNITYSPNISVYYRNHGRDFDDQGVGRGLGTAIQILKFDVLF